MEKENKYNPSIHHRRSIRLKGYDYSKEGLYFITICVKNRECIFGEVIDRKMALNEFGQIAKEEWKKTEEIRDNCKLHEFIIMPNHIHGIIEITFNKGDKEAIGKFQSPSQTIGSFIRGFKIATIKKIKERINSHRVELQFDPSEFDPSEFNPSEFNPIDNYQTSGGELQFAITKIKELDFKIWQRNYYEIIIRNKKAFENISNYIINNPAREGRIAIRPD